MTTLLHPPINQHHIRASLTFHIRRRQPTQCFRGSGLAEHTDLVKLDHVSWRNYLGFFVFHKRTLVSLLDEQMKDANCSGLSSQGTWPRRGLEYSLRDKLRPGPQGVQYTVGLQSFTMARSCSSM